MATTAATTPWCTTASAISHWMTCAASLVHLTIKQSKTDPFRNGVRIFVGRTNSDICPVAALLDYVRIRGLVLGQLFTFSDGHVLSKQQFVDRVREGLTKARVDQLKYCRHSFRIRATTAAATTGVEDCVIKTLGRWENVAYLNYT